MMKQTIASNTKKNCCSCSVCSLKCPNKCITMVEDAKGFKYPQVDEDKCSGCGLCLKVCPFLCEDNCKNSEQSDCYSLISCDEKIKSVSTSGGAFLSLAKAFLQKENSIVYGVELKDDFSVQYSAAQSYEDVFKFCKSKYVKSNAEAVFYSVATDLKNDLNVMFIGTPCSVAALKKYLGKVYDKLLTVDFVCHGTPSQKSFNLYLNSRKKTVNKYIFRYNYNGTNANSLLVYDNCQEVAKPDKDSYLRAFYANLLQMDSCFNCPWTDTHRPGDITLGDFWGIQKEDATVNAYDGVSLVLTNTSKGDELFSKITDAEIKERLISTAVNGNKRLKEPPVKNEKTEAFVELMNKVDFDKAVNKTIGKPQDIPLKLKIKIKLKSILVDKLNLKI